MVWWAVAVAPPLVAAVVVVLVAAAAGVGHTTPSLAVHAWAASGASSPTNNTTTTASTNGGGTTVVWVVGASSGIGAALVAELAAHPRVRHVILSARNVTRLQQVVDRTNHTSTTTTTTFSIVPYNALDEQVDPAVVVRQAVASVVVPPTPDSESRTIDALVWSAGVYQLEPAVLPLRGRTNSNNSSNSSNEDNHGQEDPTTATREQRHRLWRTNYHAAVDLTQALIQTHWQPPVSSSMSSATRNTTTTSTNNNNNNRRTGHLVIVSSIMAKGPHALCSTYAATKTALRSYFQTLAVEEAAWLRVQMVLPGATATDFWQHAAADQAAWGKAHHQHPSSSTNATTTTNAPVPQPFQIDPRTMVSPERVARLTVHAMQSNGWWAKLFFYEIWISNFDGLLYAWMSHYLPGLFFAINHVVAGIRRAAFAQDRADLTTMAELGRFVVRRLGRRSRRKDTKEEL